MTMPLDDLDLATRLQMLTPAQRLVIAIQLLDVGRPDLAHEIIDHVLDELARAELTGKTH